MRKLDLTPEQRRERELAQGRVRNRRYYQRRRTLVRARRNTESGREYARRYYKEHADRILGQQAVLRDPTKRREQNAHYRATHREQLREKKRLEHLADRERRLSLMRKRHAANPSEAVGRTAAWRKANPEAVFAQYAKRRAAKRTNGLIEKVDRLVIFNRDKGLCGICGQPVDPKAFTLDHVVPLSRGGAHIAENLQLAHRSCNCRKHARSMAELAAIA